MEISRQLPPNGDPNFKLFVIRGTPQQIDHAKQLIEEKIEVGAPQKIFQGSPKLPQIPRKSQNSSGGERAVLPAAQTSPQPQIPLRDPRTLRGSPQTSPEPRFSPPGPAVPRWPRSRPRGSPRPRWPHGPLQPWTLQPGSPRSAPAVSTALSGGRFSGYPRNPASLTPLFRSPGGPPPHQYPPQGWGNTYPQWQPPAPHDPSEYRGSSGLGAGGAAFWGVPGLWGTSLGLTSWILGVWGGQSGGTHQWWVGCGPLVLGVLWDVEGGSQNLGLPPSVGGLP